MRGVHLGGLDLPFEDAVAVMVGPGHVPDHLIGRHETEFGVREQLVLFILARLLIEVPPVEWRKCLLFETH